MRLKITKISDLKFNGNHPNGINKGYTKVSNAENLPVIGERFIMTGNRVEDFLATSIVESIDLEEKTFMTTNSKYKYEIL